MSDQKSAEAPAAPVEEKPAPKKPAAPAAPAKAAHGFDPSLSNDDVHRLYHIAPPGWKSPPFPTKQ